MAIFNSYFDITRGYPRCNDKRFLDSSWKDIPCLRKPEQWVSTIESCVFPKEIPGIWWYLVSGRWRNCGLENFKKPWGACHLDSPKTAAKPGDLSSRGEGNMEFNLSDWGFILWLVESVGIIIPNIWNKLEKCSKPPTSTSCIHHNGL